jgi:hypothetical protein
MLGVNAIRWAGLDREPLAEIARRIGPTLADVNAPAPDISPELMNNFDARGGYHKPWEGDEKLPELMPLVEQDIKLVATS